VTALFLGLAVVVVAFVARDVALRVLADRARERGRERADAKRVEALAGKLTSLEALVRSEVADKDARLMSHAETAHEISTKVERLLARENMKGLR
jgi:hypothetical protein